MQRSRTAIVESQRSVRTTPRSRHIADRRQGAGTAGQHFVVRKIPANSGSIKGPIITGRMGLVSTECPMQVDTTLRICVASKGNSATAGNRRLVSPCRDGSEHDHCERK